MRKMICAFAAAGLLAGVAGADSHVSGRLTKQDARESKGRIGNFVVNHLTGELTPGGGTVSDATIVYDNTINLGAFVAAAAVGSELGDDLVMTAGGQVTELSLSLWNSDLNGGDLISCDIEIKFHDYVLNLIDSVVIPVDLSAQPLGPGFVVGLTTDDLTAENIVLPRYVFMTQTVTNPVGTGIFEVGAALNNPVETGWSADLFYLDTITNNFFGGDVTANLEYAVTVDTPTGETLIDSTGAPHSVNFDPGTGFAPTFLGFSSGNVAAGLEQRWCAIPFSVASNTSISVVDAYGFGPAGAEPDNVSYIIWKRSGLNKPLSNADKFAEGMLDTFNPVGGLGPIVARPASSTSSRWVRRSPFPRATTT
jgi:hypothetical protein